MGYEPQVGELLELRCLGGGWGKAEIKYLSPTTCVWLWIREDGGYQIEHSERPDKVEFRPTCLPCELNIFGFDAPLYLGDGCEFYSDTGGWCSASVLFIGSHLAIIRYDHPSEGQQEACINWVARGGEGLETRLRPRSEGERSAAVAEMVEAKIAGGLAPWVCGELYDAGYRKVPTND